MKIIVTVYSGIPGVSPRNYNETEIVTALTKAVAMSHDKRNHKVTVSVVVWDSKEDTPQKH